MSWPLRVRARAICAKRRGAPRSDEEFGLYEEMRRAVRPDPTKNSSGSNGGGKDSVSDSKVSRAIALAWTRRLCRTLENVRQCASPQSTEKANRGNQSGKVGQ